MRNIIQGIIVIYAERRDMKTKKIEIGTKEYYSRVLKTEELLYTIEVSHDMLSNNTIIVGPFDVEDLKKLRKLIRKTIREHENNSNKRW